MTHRLSLGFLLSLALMSVAPSPADAQTPARRGANVPDCGSDPVPLCKTPLTFDARDAEDRLDGRKITYWVDGDLFNVAVAATGEDRHLSGTIQDWLTPLNGDIQGGSYRLPALDTSLIEMWVRGMPELGEVRFQGANAPAPPHLGPLAHGTLQTTALPSDALDRTRNVTVYRPSEPPPAQGYPVVVMADGEALESFAQVADGLIGTGDIPPIVIIGVWVGVDPENPNPGGMRFEEYVKGVDDAAFSAHDQFVVRDVLPFAVRTLDLSEDRQDRLLFGFSNGADWALSFAESHPDLASHVAAFSPSGLGKPVFASQPVDLHIEAGRYELPFLVPAQEICNEANSAGVRCLMSIYDAGHSEDIWRYEFARTLRAVFGSPTPRPGALPGS